MSIPKSNECQTPLNDGLLPLKEFHFAEQYQQKRNETDAASVNVDYSVRANAYDDYKLFERNAIEESLNSSSFKDCGVEDVDFKGGLLSISSSPSCTSTTSNDSAKSDLSITTTPSLTSKGFANTFKLLETQVEDHIERANTILDQLNVNLSLKSDTSNAEEDRDGVDYSRLDLELEVIQRLVGLLPLRKREGNLHRECEQIVCDKKAIAFVEMLYGFVAKFLSYDGDWREKLELLGICETNSLKYHACKSLNGCDRLKILRNIGDNQVLCGNRVSQMTRAYDDIEAVTRLLEEKEKDLELTVQIGKELLAQNNALESRINELDADLKSANDERAQLIHELQKKNELINVLTDDADDGSKTTTPTFCKSITLDLLQKKITTLQDENKSLKMEACQLADETTIVEEHERQLMEDITSQLNSTSKHCDNLNLELERQREENRLQHEQIIFLTARLSEAEMRLHQLTHDNEEHMTLLNITKENQNSLAQELIEFKQRYQEVLALLQETQEQLRQQRKKTMPQVRGGIMSSMGMLAPDSLQSELMESSLYSENSMDSGISSDIARVNDRLGRLMSSQVHGVYGGVAAAAGSSYNASGILPPYKRVFETVRCANQNEASVARLGTTPTLQSSSGLRISSMAMGSSMGGKTLSCESLTSQSDDGYPAQTTGVPGAPGAKDLEAALKRLTPAEVLARRAMLSYAPAGTYSYDDHPQAPLPMGLRTPDSIMSTGSSGVSSTHMSSSLNQWRLPDKLQIVKPMEGSLTLHHWSRLATPTLSGLLEERPGVKIRGGRGLDELGMQVYTLSDVEEDVHDDLPGKQFEPTGHIYTFTTSTIMHPDDGLVNDLSFLSQSQMSSRMASTSTSRQPSCPPTPRGLSRKNSCSTFSVNLGLASMLNERGIKAVTPSALNTPAGPNFTPTVTPCNSPEGSPTRSMSPEPFLGGILSSGADLIRRKLIGVDIERQKQKIKLSRLERRALRSLKLVEKVESIGLENIIAAQPSAMNQLASGIASRSASPMAQLTSLKNIHTKSNRMVEDISFDRNQIKGVLHKGLKAKGASPASSGCTSMYGSDNDTEEIPQTLINNISDPTTNTSTKEYYVGESSAQKAIAEGTTSIAADATSSMQNTRVKQMQRQKSRRNLKNGLAMQRADLGTIGGGRVRSDLGQVSAGAARGSMDYGSLGATRGEDRSDAAVNMDGDSACEESQSLTQAVVGSISSLLFGRKGGWL